MFGSIYQTTRRKIPDDRYIHKLKIVNEAVLVLFQHISGKSSLRDGMKLAALSGQSATGSKLEPYKAIPDISIVSAVCKKKEIKKEKERKKERTIDR
jgi:hypothetical protein